MASEDGHSLDGWLIGELRNHTRSTRVDELLLGGPATAELVCRVERAERELSALAERLRLAERRLEGSSVHHAVAHTCFVPHGEGYELVEADGPPPRAGAEVEVAGARYRVVRAGRSPLPFDRRPCVFLEALWTREDGRALLRPV